MSNEDFTSRFSETVEKILREAEQIAQALNSAVDTQHLLTAIASNPGTIAYETLRESLVSPERISLLIASSPSTDRSTNSVSPSLKKVLKNAYRRAAYYGTPTVDSEHILLAMMNQKDSNAFKIITELNADPLQIKDQLEDYFEQIRLPENIMQQDQLDDEEFEQPLPMVAGPARTNQKSKSILDYFTTDLTKLAKDNKLDPVIGRETEITRMIQILVRRIKNNPVLTGEPGVGKTAIVEGLATRIAQGKVPTQLQEIRILSLDLALLVSGTTYRGQFEERTKKLLDEVIKVGNVILFVDEIHTIVGAGAAEGSIDLGHILKPALAKGQLSMIGATTNDEYRKYVERDTALERRFQRINVNEPTVEETIEILKGLRSAYEQHHGVSITDEAIEAASELAKRYINDRFLPDKAIDVIDEAAAATQLEGARYDTTNQINDLEKQRKNASLEHQKAAEGLEYEKAVQYRAHELRLQSEIEKLRLTLPKSPISRSIQRDDIAKIISQATGIPITNLQKTDRARLSKINDILSEHIVGQDEAVSAISTAVKRSTVGVSDPNRPLGSFIFLGPTGVGKTELAKILASEVFGREESLVKIDMSEFSEKHNVSRLVGAPPGYVGYDDAGKLTETVRRQPYSVILLDEIEKAHPDVFNMLLQVMEDGYLTDAKGRRVSFKNTILIMTSNIGMSELNKQAEIGFKVKDLTELNERYEQIKTQINNTIKDYFRPEFINRLDQIIVFKPLGKAEVKQIVARQIQKLQTRLQKEGITINVADSALEHLAAVGFDPEYGARPVRRAITEQIENPLAELIVNGKININSPIRVLKKGNKLTLVK